MLNEEDALIVDALQLAPRAPWSAVGDVLGIAPTTAAKRFQRLVDEGVAWVTASPGMVTSSPQCYGHVEITCRSDSHFSVASAIAAHPLAVTVEVITGPADLLVTVGAADLPTISHYVLHHLDRVDGVLSTRTSVVTRLYSEGGSWRLRRLPDAAVASLVQLQATEFADEEPSQPSGPPSDSGKAIVELLTADGRMAYTEIAERLNLSPTTARRQNRRAAPVGPHPDPDRCRGAGCRVAGRELRARGRAGRRPAGHGAAAQRMRQSRLTATVAAGPQLLQSSWLQTVEEVHRMELSMAEQHPQLQIVERILVLRVIKRMGRLIGPDGRAAGVVPINIWDDTLCGADG